MKEFLRTNALILTVMVGTLGVALASPLIGIVMVLCMIPGCCYYEWRENR